MAGMTQCGAQGKADSDTSRGSRFEATDGQTLRIGAAEEGVYGYLSVAGGFATSVELGGRGYHGIGGLGQVAEIGQCLSIEPGGSKSAQPRRLPPEPVTTRPIRVMPGPQTGLFSTTTIDRFEATSFIRSPRGNRVGTGSRCHLTQARR